MLLYLEPNLSGYCCPWMDLYTPCSDLCPGCMFDLAASVKLVMPLLHMCGPLLQVDPKKNHIKLRTAAMSENFRGGESFIFTLASRMKNS